MLRALAVLLVGLAVSAASLEAQVYVRGYYRSNGTYVQPHYRSAPDRSPYNNYSYPGNLNPYTGRVAAGNASTYLQNYYSPRSHSSSSYSSSYSNYNSSYRYSYTPRTYSYSSPTYSYPSYTYTHPSSSYSKYSPRR